MADTFARMRQLTGTSADWASNNLIIGLGEIAIEVVSAGVTRMKIGDGATNYSALPYFDPGLGTFVLKAGDTMSGTLTTPGLNVPDTGSATVPTVPYTDSSRKVATTAFVKNLLATRGQGDAIYAYGGATLGTPATGHVIIDPGVGAARQIAISEVDADGVGRLLTLLQPGDSLIMTNEFTPVTSYARYDLVSAVTDHGTWVEFGAVLITQTGGAEAPPLNTRVKLTGYLNLATGDGPILGVTAGQGLAGGGSVGVVDIAMSTLAYQSLVPTGGIIDFAGAAAPTGWYLCDGSLKNRTTDAALFAVIGVIFGAGDGTTTFGVPDLRGRVTAHPDSGGSNRLSSAMAVGDSATRGSSGGFQSHQLLVSELASHTHTLSANTPGTAFIASAGTSGTVSWTGGNTMAAVGATAATAGGNAGHNNTQPTMIMNKIIRR